MKKIISKKYLIMFFDIKKDFDLDSSSGINIIVYLLEFKILALN